MNNRYLYYRGKYGNNVYRSLVIREGEKSIWIKQGKSEDRMYKKTMSIGSDWDITHYYEETPELLGRYRTCLLQRKFLRKLEELKGCENETVMKHIVLLDYDTDISL